jgi:hypothetical protein
MGDPLQRSGTDTNLPPASTPPPPPPDPAESAADEGVNEAEPDTGRDIVPPDDERPAAESRQAHELHDDESQAQRREGVVSDPDVSLP